MLLVLTYLYRNLTRNGLRTILTCAAVSLPITIYVLSMAVVRDVQRFLDNSATQLRLAVTHKSSIVNPLPSGYRPRIEALDPTHTRVISVCGLRWIGGRVENDPRMLSTLAVDPDNAHYTFPEYLRDPVERANWIKDKQAIIAGSATADQFGWKLGDRIQIRPSVPPYTLMEFHIVSLSGAEAADRITNFCRRDYLDEELKQNGYLDGFVSFFFVKCASKADLDHFGREIDQEFANATDPTMTQDEKSFMNQFITQQFDLPRNLTIFAIVTVFVAVMAAANTMSMNFRDRLNEFATLKSLGFGGRLIFGMIQTESMLLCIIGGVFGAAVPYVAFTYTPLKDFTVPLIQTLKVGPDVCVQAVLISIGIGLAAAVWPSILAMRLKVVSALRSLE